MCRWPILSSLALVFACGSVSSSRDDDAAPPDADNDPCLTNTCECEVDADCGDFEICDTTSTPGRICVCAPTYEDNGTACAFTGAPADPGFQATDVWIPTDAARATFDPANQGGSDLGVAQLSVAGSCQLDSFTQTFTMPPRDRAEVFAVDVNYRFVDPDFVFPFIPVGVQIGGGWYRELPAQEGFNQHSFCLGDGGYGGDVEFRITPNSQHFECPSGGVFMEFDRFAVRPAMPGECPIDVGRPDNADMEAAGGWTFTTAGDGTAALVPGIGAGGSQGIQLTTTTRCSGGNATAKISLPQDATLANSAIEFFSGGNANDIVEVQLDGKPISRFTPTDGARRVCVPDSAKGTVADLTFSLRRTQGNGDCTIPRVRNVTIDDVSVVSEPACGDVAQEFDNGFEVFFNTPGLTPGWAAIEVATNTTISPATIDNNQGQANSGFGSLHLRAFSRCTTTRAERQILVPAPQGAEGPAVVAFINAPASDGTIQMSAPVAGSITAPEGVGYQRNVLCLPNLLRGRPITVSLGAAGGGGLCAENPNTNGFIDDVTIGTDPSCPAN